VKYSLSLFTPILISTLLLSWAAAAPKSHGSDCNVELVSPALTEAVRKNDFRHNRGLHEYVERVGPNLTEALAQLKAGDTWVDFGAGQGWAGLEFLAFMRSMDDAPTVYGVMFKRPPPSLPYLRTMEAKVASHWRVLEGRLIEDIPASDLPQIDVATDIFGPLAYTKDLSAVLNKYLHWLKVPGQSAVYTEGLSLKEETRDPHGHTFILDGRGETLTLAEWLERQPGIAVWTPARTPRNSLIFTKTQAGAQVAPLELLYYDPYSAPPTRVFRARGVSTTIKEGMFWDPRLGQIRALSDFLKEIRKGE
jgi:hypothetical protein